MLFTVTGITNKTLRGLMTGLLHRPYSMNQASYDLSRLARNGLIHRVPGRNRSTLTRDGLLFAHIYTKVYDHVLCPLMTPDRPGAPPELASRDRHPRPARHQPHRRRPRPHRRLTKTTLSSTARPRRHHASCTATSHHRQKLKTNVKVVAPKVLYAPPGTSPGRSGPSGSSADGPR